MEIHVAVLFLVGVLLVGILAVLSIMFAVHDLNPHLLTPTGVILAIIALFNLGWFIYASCQPSEIDHTVDYEVKTVTYPNGQQVQMFTVDGQHINANERFKVVFPEGGKVRRNFYKRVYSGVYFPENNPNYFIPDEEK